MQTLKKPGWNTEERELIKALYPYFGPGVVAYVFQRLGIRRNYGAIESHARRNGIKFTNYPDDFDSSTVSEDVLAIIQEMINDSNVDDEIENDIDAELDTETDEPSYVQKFTSRKVSTTMDDLKLSLDNLRKEIVPLEIPEPTDMNTGESYCILLSDLHIGSLIEDENNEVIYDTQIALEMIRAMAQKFYEIIHLVKKGTLIDEIVLILAGDLIENDVIYDNQTFEIDSHAGIQLRNTTRAIWELIVNLRATFKVPVRVITVKGNHGRTGAITKANFDSILYDFLVLLRDVHEDNGISIKTTDREYIKFEVKGWKGLVRHKLPAEDKSSASLKKFGGWYAQHGFDFCVGGHWHMWGIGNYGNRPIFRNGALSPGNEYAESLSLGDGEPTMLVWGATRKRIPTSVYPVNFGIEEKEDDDQEND